MRGREREKKEREGEKGNRIRKKGCYESANAVTDFNPPAGVETSTENTDDGLRRGCKLVESREGFNLKVKTEVKKKKKESKGR